MSPLYNMLCGDIASLNKTRSALPGHSCCSTPESIYGEYTVSPTYVMYVDPLNTVLLSLLFEKIGEDCLPYLSDNTIPN